MKNPSYCLKTRSLTNRKSLVNIKDFATLPPPSASFNRFIDSLPEVLAGKDFKRVVRAILRAVRQSRLVGVGLGAHVVKCGLSPVIIDLIKQGVIKAIAMNGATAIHDYEISLVGKTSEDVAENIKTGRFGMVRETADAFIRASQQAVEENIGLGSALGRLILKDRPLRAVGSHRNKFASFSILASAYQHKIPVTVHIALGTDTVHMYPEISGAELGESSMTDFRLFTSVICGLRKGVWLNIGSAVILPEVFLKAVSVARNLGHKLDSFLAVNLDMFQHYRPRQNVTGRPAPEGINLTGHHEIMLPLLRLSVLSKLRKV
ncbi:MAG: hypothetical protein QME51_07460 [Planctomycetota bacterium]|nr:hypothetical protein [Planctomycetota bacterium]MDI6788192.1 hypothetical protein [Planctomycetota bacterium]